MKVCISVFALMMMLVGCETIESYAPPATHAAVEAVKITVADFHGRPDIYVDIRGRLMTNAAQLVETKQSRGRGNVLKIEIFEQTPRGGTGTNRVPNPPFQTRIPIDTMGLVPGQVYVVDANGAKTQFQMPCAKESPGGFLTSSSSTGLELPGY